MILNYILIVKFGSKGAAYATLISIALQSVVFNLFFKKTRITEIVFPLRLYTVLIKITRLSSKGELNGPPAS